MIYLTVAIESFGKTSLTVVVVCFRANVKISFYRQDTNGNVERLEDDSVLKTKKVVSSYFGDYEDIIKDKQSLVTEFEVIMDTKSRNIYFVKNVSLW